ncbi:hypothetical protein Tco_0467412, partial [Tanacetum coccineum]
EEPFEYENDDEEEERLAPADSSTIPAVNHVPSAGDTDALETDEAAPTLVPSPRQHTAMIFDKYGYIKNHKKTVKNRQTRIRGTEKHKRSQGFKAEAK